MVNTYLGMRTYLLNLFNILMILNKWIIQWFSFDVTTRSFQEQGFGRSNFSLLDLYANILEEGGWPKCCWSYYLPPSKLIWFSLFQEYYNGVMFCTFLFVASFVSSYLGSCLTLLVASIRYIVSKLVKQLL